MTTGTLLMLLFSAVVGGVIGVWQARRRARRVVAERIAAAVEARLLERYGRRPGAVSPDRREAGTGR
ncbi:hypothetical protein JN531_009715 [Flagellatimonas centrodinii]|uniref:hypothetical protein n=1 Tax=Flagellatimonas centrodinii TaxID=2806210 RepID=UPI001FF0184E|nr:hypothetical protein [Flagellatimonas centrodinii]ULQ45405.1 hypothetical protein JN531_009715 [Flagellatimonas centrodinii]